MNLQALINSLMLTLILPLVFIVGEQHQRIERLESLPKSELVCTIPDSKGRNVCRYVEVD